MDGYVSASNSLPLPPSWVTLPSSPAQVCFMDCSISVVSATKNIPENTDTHHPDNRSLASRTTEHCSTLSLDETPDVGHDRKRTNWRNRLVRTLKQALGGCVTPQTRDLRHFDMGSLSSFDDMLVDPAAPPPHLTRTCSEETLLWTLEKDGQPSRPVKPKRTTRSKQAAPLHLKFKYEGFGFFGLRKRKIRIIDNTPLDMNFSPVDIMKPIYRTASEKTLLKPFNRKSPSDQYR